MKRIFQISKVPVSWNYEPKVFLFHHTREIHLGLRSSNYIEINKFNILTKWLGFYKPKNRILFCYVKVKAF